MAFRRLAATSIAASGPMMSACWPRNVIVAKREPNSAIVSCCESLPIGHEYRSVALRPVRACLYVSLPRGKGRDREGT